MRALIPSVVVYTHRCGPACWLAGMRHRTHARPMVEQSDDRSAGTTAPTDAARPVAPHRHRVLIGALFGLATVVGVFAVLAVWANRQALNTDNWTSTSTRLLADPKIQAAVTAYSVDQLFKTGVVESQIKAGLPPRLEPLAGPINSGLEQLAARAAPRVLASPQVQNAWRLANRAARRTLLKIINGGGSPP